MPNQPVRRPSPRGALKDPRAWPNGTTDDPVAERAQALARNLHDALGKSGMSMRQVAEAAGLSVGTVSHLVNGNSWADTRTVLTLEQVLGRSLWPKR